MSGTRTLFLAFAALALSALLLRPVCNAAHPHMHLTEPASCCQNVAGGADAKPLDLAGDGAAKPLVFASSLASLYIVAPYAPLRAVPAGASPPPRSFYARSSRILS